MSVIDRFSGEDGHRRLLEVLADQTLVAGNADLAQDLATAGVLVEFQKDAIAIEQGALENDVFFIAFGSCDIIVNGKTVARRGAGTHVGEMAAIHPSQKRSATVVAAEDSVLLRVDEPSFSKLAERYPALWKRVARELARRLEQRNALVTQTHEQIRLFIISSSEALQIAWAIQNALSRDALVTVWTDGVFKASAYPLESLEAAVEQSDFAVAIANLDDHTESRDEVWPTTRDNVVLEYGMFVGKLGRQRSFLIERRGEEVKLPSDLAGMNTLKYQWSGAPKDLPAAIAPVCNRIRDIINDLGPNN